jgi:hypothetical protein
MGRTGSSSGRPSASILNSATDGDTVLAPVDVFLEWCQKNKAKRTYEWYVEKTSSFACRIPRTLTVGQLKPLHVQDWVDAHPKWAPGMKRACITAVQRVFTGRSVRAGSSPTRSDLSNSLPAVAGPSCSPKPSLSEFSPPYPPRSFGIYLRWRGRRAVGPRKSSGSRRGTSTSRTAAGSSRRKRPRGNARPESFI